MEAKHFKLIFFLSIVLSVMGIVTEIFDYFQNVSIEQNTWKMIVSYVLWIFKSIYIYIGLHQTSLNVYNLIFYIILLFGSVFFYLSKGKEIRLIRFFYSVLMISNIFILLRIILLNTVLSYDVQVEPEFQMKRYIFKILGFLFCVLYIFLGYKVLKITGGKTELDSKKKENSEIIEITETPKVERFLHWFFDTVIIVSLLFNVFELIYNYQKHHSGEIIPVWLNNKFGLLLLIVIIRFIYYPLFEKIFGGTPGKFLTNSTVINPKSEKISTENALERTLYRHIPFEIFSFLGRKGWHDSLSKTYVVKEKNNGVKSNYIVWVFCLCFGIFCFYMYKNFSERF